MVSSSLQRGLKSPPSRGRCHKHGPLKKSSYRSRPSVPARESREEEAEVQREGSKQEGIKSELTSTTSLSPFSVAPIIVLATTMPAMPIDQATARGFKIFDAAEGSAMLKRGVMSRDGCPAVGGFYVACCGLSGENFERA